MIEVGAYQFPGLPAYSYALLGIADGIGRPHDYREWHRHHHPGLIETTDNDRLLCLISLGEEVTWRAWHFGVPFRMTSRITEMESPDYFVDEQVKGPFRRFRHVHEFSQDSSGTTMVDRIEFAAPFGPVGRLAEKLVLARYLQKLIEKRNRHLIGASAHG